MSLAPLEPSRSTCRRCGHPASGQTPAALVDAMAEHALWHRLVAVIRLQSPEPETPGAHEAG